MRPEVLRCDRIWGQAPHNAFTDLIRFQDAWYCVFREGRGHVSPDGALRLLRSDDGHRWESVMRFTRSDADLRDAKLSITPQGELMLLGAGAMHNPDPHRHQTFAWFSEDAVSWTPEIPIGEPDYWLWRVSFHRGLGLGIGYTTNSPQDRHIRLYGSQDGRRWSTLVPRLYERGYPNETQIRFVGDRAYCLLRRDGASPEGNSGLLGIADPPYTDWNWSDLQVRIGGPAMLVTPHGKMIAVVRLYDGRTRTSVCQIDPVHGSIRELLALPSGGDTSYAGLVWYDDRLWISYYSAHEARSNAFATAIYLAEVTIP
ncbi:MAG: exo-alpha-sialidase [Planctomycetota bacterium]|nr:MAG: exo-alpha-sialidase [Planctomycetota bacterium]